MNCNGKMSFGDFIFPVNPSIIRVSRSRRVKSQPVTFGKTVVTDMGEDKTVISGEGEFFGGNAERDFALLSALLKKGGTEMLYVPSQRPIPACFEALELIGRDTQGVIFYSFRFVESRSGSPADRSEIIADGTSSLFDYSFITGLSVGMLRSLNPGIKRPDIPVEAGRSVFLC